MTRPRRHAHPSAHVRLAGYRSRSKVRFSGPLLLRLNSRRRCCPPRSMFTAIARPTIMRIASRSTNPAISPKCITMHPSRATRLHSRLACRPFALRCCSWLPLRRSSHNLDQCMSDEVMVAVGPGSSHHKLHQRDDDENDETRPKNHRDRTLKQVLPPHRSAVINSPLTCTRSTVRLPNLLIRKGCRQGESCKEQHRQHPVLPPPISTGGAKVWHPLFRGSPRVRFPQVSRARPIPCQAGATYRPALPKARAVPNVRLSITVPPIDL